MNTKKKLIEVALPLEAINKASAREKSIRHGHPSTLHLWWARRPLAAARAVIFAQMVDDPSAHPDQFPTEEEQEAERKRLFRLIEELVKWENTANEDVLNQAQDEIWRSWRATCAENRDHPRAAELFNPGQLPAFHDPFAGGGALPLEAQRLGLEAYASDLNPVAVLINKAMIEIPPKFAGRPPVNPEARKDKQLFSRRWRGAQGLAEDVRYYGQWMRAEAEKRIGHLYPKVKVVRQKDGTYRHATPEEIEAWSKKQGAGSKNIPASRSPLPTPVEELTVIAWLWARTVKSPNPAFAHVDVPLVSTFMLSTKPGKEAYVEPVIENGAYRFTVKMGKPKNPEGAKNGTKLARGANFRCVMSGEPISGNYIKAEGKAGRMSARLMAIVAEGDHGRVYLSPTSEHETITNQAQPTWKPSGDVPARLTGGTCYGYGLTEWGDLFTPRQLVALTTFSDLVLEARERVKQDALSWECGRPARQSAPRPLKEWHSRGYLPHWEAGEIPQHLVFRLHDSLPADLRATWENELHRLAKTEAQRELRKQIESTLDRGLGACHLKDPEIAQVIENALLQFDGERYRLHAWVIIPNHVHVLATPLPGYSLSEILHSWKSYTAKEANRILRKTGPFWMEEYFDRAMRDGKHYSATVEYIEQNPVKAGLCETAEEWSWSSAKNQEEKRAGRPRSQDEIPLNDGGTGAQAYADAMAVYLGFAVDKGSNYWSSLCSWHSSRDTVTSTFGRQALPMVWDFAEANPFSESTGNYLAGIEQAHRQLLTAPLMSKGFAIQGDAAFQSISENKVVSTDPPYYNNIGYADLSDFFYIWLRRSLKSVFKNLFATLSVPKAEELVATPYRHGSKEAAETFFLNGMAQAMHRLAVQAHSVFPVTIYYAFKQSETESDGTSSTGWETFLDAVIKAGFALTGTWPMRTEYTGNLKKNFNALASSIVLVCRPRVANALTATRREFLNKLRSELPVALAYLQRSNIAPVDLAQAAIGPGMAIYTKYSKVLDAEGNPLTVREALALINQTLDEVLAEQEGDFDSDTRWALAWFDQYGFNEGEFGQADVLARAKNTSVAGLAEAGILVSKGGKVRLLKPEELSADWDPATDSRLTVWEVSLQLIRALQKVGEEAAARIRLKIGAHAGAARELAYRLYIVCERRKWAQDALAFNSLVVSWPEIERLARENMKPRSEQTSMFEE